MWLLDCILPNHAHTHTLVHISMVPKPPTYPLIHTQYFKNVLFEYMMGRQTQHLVKVTVLPLARSKTNKRQTSAPRAHTPCACACNIQYDTKAQIVFTNEYIETRSNHVVANMQTLLWTQ